MEAGDETRTAEPRLQNILYDKKRRRLMDVKLYDVVRLITGETACVVHIYEAGRLYEAVTEMDSGEAATGTVTQEQIAEVVKW